MSRLSLLPLLICCGLMMAQTSNSGEDYNFKSSKEESEFAVEYDDEPSDICQCGVFLSNEAGVKARRGRPRGPPKGEPVITYDTESASQPCGSTGNKHCINRCLDVILKHLPRAGPVICGSVERDVHRERAFLYIRNCGSEWIPTSFSAGKEFCCRDGHQYKC